MTSKDLFEILAREHAAMLTVYLRAAVHDAVLVDDLFQETMLTAWRTLERFDRSRPFGPWLRGIAAKLILAHRRKSGRHVVLFDAKALEHLETRHESLERLSGDTLDEKLETLRECLRLLPPRYREAVELRYREGMQGRGLAGRLEISIEALKKRLQRGRARLLDCLSRKLAPVGVLR